MPPLKDATKRPPNVGEVIQPATPFAQQVPPIIPREQPGLGPASLGPAPAIWTTDYDKVRQWSRPGTSQARFPALPTKANPQLNAAARSVTTTVIKNSPAPAFTGVSSVGLSMPSIFVVSGSPVTSAGTLAAALATQPVGTFFQVAPAGLTNLTGTFTNTYAVATTPATHPTITFAPPSAGWAFYMESQAGGGISTAPSGWTVWGDGGALVLSSTTPVTATDTLPLALSWCNTAITFSGAIPTFVANHQAAFTFHSGSASASTTITPSAGNYLIISVYGTAGVGGSVNGVSVSAGSNTVAQVASASAKNSSFNGPLALAVYIAPSVAGGSTTIKGSISGNFPGGSTFTLSVTEVTPFATGSNIPVFAPFPSSSITGISGSAIAGGLVALAFGGTGADLSATGGLSQFLSQGPSGAITVVRPDFSDLAGAAGQQATRYNGIPLVSNGIPSEVATVDLVGQTAAKATTTLYVVPATGAGQYELSWNAKVTTADAVSSTLGALTITYTDPDGVVQTITAPAHNKAGAPETSDTGNSTTAVLLGVPLMLNCKASTNITYATAYVSNTAGAMAYNLHLKLKAL